MFWSYTEDIKLLTSNKSPEELSKEISKTPARIKYRRLQLRMSKVTVEQLKNEEKLIIDNFTTKSVADMARELENKEIYVSRRIRRMKDEGKLPEEKPKIMSTKKPKFETMPKVMIPEPPKNAFSKKNIQKDILQVGKVYVISKKAKKGKIKKARLKCIGVYQNYYLLEDERGRKDSLMKVDYHLKNWEYEEIS